MGVISEPLLRKDMVSTLLGAITLLGEYSIFIEKTIEEYYGNIYAEYKNLD